MENRTFSDRHTHSEYSRRGLFLLVNSSDTGGGVVRPKLTEKVGVTEKDFFITSPVNKKYIMNWYAFIIPRYTCTDYCTWFVYLSV